MLVRDLAVLEPDDDAERELHVPPGRRDARKELRHLDVVREGEDELVYHLVLADGPWDRRDRDVLRPLSDEVVAVELADTLEADPAGHDRDVVDVWVLRHGRHRRVEVHVDELRCDVVVEDRREVVVGRHPAGT